MAFRRLPRCGGARVLRLCVIISVLMVGLSFIGFYFEEDIADHAGLVLVVIELLDDALFGRGDFSELLIRLDICDLLELFDQVSLLDVQLLHLALLDLLAQVGQGETQKCKPESKLWSSVKHTPYSPRNYHYKSVYNVEDHAYPSQL